MISAATTPAQRTHTAPVTIRRVGAAVVAAGTALVAACSTPATGPAAPPPPPPRQAAEVVPYRPLPPAGAAYVMQIPPRGADGQRITVNSNLSDDRLVWHLRSAWNVAALNCLAPEFEPILTGYRTFLNNNVRGLKAVNDRIEKTYNDRHRVRRDAIVARDRESTQVYNFFANPAARSGFCLAALDVAQRYLAAPKTLPLAFAQANFPVMMSPHEDFFNQYEAYQRASAEWDAKYGERYGPSQPGWVAVQQARANGEAVPTFTAFAASAVSQTVIDPETGAAVPVVPVQQGFVSQPVVEPIATPQANPSPAPKR